MPIFKMLDGMKEMAHGAPSMADDRAVTSTLRQERTALIREHIDSESAHEFERSLATFAEARYEVVPTGDVHAGPEAVAAFYRESHVAFPDFHFENERMLHADDAVVVEVDFVGTHLGTWRGLPATGRRVRYRMCNVFEFRGAALMCERLHFDLHTVLRQLGIARDPTSLGGRLTTFANHPLTILGAFARQLRR
jgi:steroid delta-isomerase-like uncharacterized protein